MLKEAVYPCWNEPWTKQLLSLWSLLRAHLKLYSAPDIIGLLLAGADPTSELPTGASALHVAMYGGLTKVSQCSQSSDQRSDQRWCGAILSPNCQRRASRWSLQTLLEEKLGDGRSGQRYCWRRNVRARPVWLGLLGHATFVNCLAGLCREHSWNASVQDGTGCLKPSLTESERGLGYLWRWWKWRAERIRAGVQCVGMGRNLNTRKRAFCLSMVRSLFLAMVGVIFNVFRYGNGRKISSFGGQNPCCLVRSMENLRQAIPLDRSSRWYTHLQSPGSMISVYRLYSGCIV